VPDLDALGMKLSSTLEVTPKEKEVPPPPTKKVAPQAQVSEVKEITRETKKETTQPTKAVYKNSEVQSKKEEEVMPKLTTKPVLPEIKDIPVKHATEVFKKPETVREVDLNTKDKSSTVPEDKIKEKAPLKFPTMTGLAPFKLNGAKTEPKQKLEMPKQPEPSQPIMMKDLKHRAWPQDKNVKTVILGLQEDKVGTLREDSVAVTEYYEYIGKEVNKYCEAQPKTGYVPM
jgi:hypothetical protein